MAAGQSTNTNAAVTGDQFYVTHCTTADSVMNAPGYSVRAASDADNPDILKRALEYPPYELPMDMWREKPTKALTPRRLARTRHPNGGVWVIHSVYLEKDTMNRDRSYFTHLMAMPTTVDAASVLESWDAEGWTKEYAPGSPKNLRRGPIPKGKAISRERLTEFLSQSVSGPTELCAVVCPARLRTAVDARRSLVGRFLNAMVLLKAARDSGQQRDRLFVHAEPGLTAMLLYAATRILPPAFTADLTFSTFEPAHRSIRDYKLSSVVGTYLGSAGKGLDPDLVTRGFGLDTIQVEKSSRELAEAVPWHSGIAELLELAANGEWELIEDIHKLVGNDSDALDRVPDAIPLARAEGRLKRGGVTVEDLRALKADTRGSTVIAQHPDEVWNFLRDEVLTNVALRKEYKDFLTEPERLKFYRDEACKALGRGELDGWDTRWAVIRDVCDDEQLKGQAEKAQKSLDKYLPTLAMPARNRLRSACSESGAWPDHHLLAPTSLDELDTLLGPKMPPHWQGYTCFAVMGPDDKNWLLDTTKPARPAMRLRVRNHLMFAPTPVLTGYLKQAKDYISTMPGFLYDLLQPFKPECVPFLSRVIDGGADIIEPGDWVKMLGDVDIYGQREKRWEGFLLKNDHLAKLLAGFKADPAASDVWAGYAELIGPALIDGDEWETVIYNQLSKARAALGAANIPLKGVAPAAAVRRLKAADTLLAVMADPGAADHMEHGQLTEAFQVFGIAPLEGLRKIYYRANLQHLDLNTDPRLIVPFAVAFRSCFPVTHEYYTARAAVLQWVLLSASCPDATRVMFQTHFIREYVPGNWHQNLLREHPPIPFHPAVIAFISQSLAHARTQSARAELPASRSEEAESEPEVVSAATKRARGKSGGGRAARRKGADGIPPWVWLIGLAVLIVIVAVVAVASLNKTPPSEPDSTPTPAKPAPAKEKKKDKGNT